MMLDFVEAGILLGRTVKNGHRDQGIGRPQIFWRDGIWQDGGSVHAPRPEDSILRHAHVVSNQIPNYSHPSNRQLFASGRAAEGSIAVYFDQTRNIESRRRAGLHEY